MKIAISGTHNVGKTTLAEALHDSLPGYEYRTEPYYELSETGYAFAETPSADDYLVQLKHSIKQISSRDTQIIFDRSPIDLLAYIRATGDDELVSELYDEVEQAMKNIDLLVFVPIEEPDRIEGSENELPELRHDVNDILHEWISDLETANIIVTGSTANRQKLVLDQMAIIDAS